MIHIPPPKSKKQSQQQHNKNKPSFFFFGGETLSHPQNAGGSKKKDGVGEAGVVSCRVVSCVCLPVLCHGLGTYSTCPRALLCCSFHARVPWPVFPPPTLFTSRVQRLTLVSDRQSAQRRQCKNDGGDKRTPICTFATKNAHCCSPPPQLNQVFFSQARSLSFLFAVFCFVVLHSILHSSFFIPLLILTSQS